MALDHLHLIYIRGVRTPCKRQKCCDAAIMTKTSGKPMSANGYITKNCKVLSKHDQ